jgi:outer membrane protein assembly factor BamB
VTRLANGNFQIFDNGWRRPEKTRSRIVEMDPKTGKIVWKFEPVIGSSFYSVYQGCAQKLPNGNILVTSSNHGHVFELTYGPKPKVVWEWVNPVMAGDRIKCFYDDAKDSVSGFEELGSNMIHRSYRYGKDYPGLAGKDLSKAEPLSGECPAIWKMAK